MGSAAASFLDRFPNSLQLLCYMTSVLRLGVFTWPYSAVDESLSKWSVLTWHIFEHGRTSSTHGADDYFRLPISYISILGTKESSNRLGMCHLLLPGSRLNSPLLGRSVSWQHISRFWIPCSSPKSRGSATKMALWPIFGDSS